MFAEYGLPKAIIFVVGTNFILQKVPGVLQENKHISCSFIVIQQSEKLLDRSIYKFINRIMKECIDTNWDVNLALMQIRMMPMGPGLPSPYHLTDQYG